MSIFNWLDRRGARSVKATRKPAHRNRLHVERLEDRVVLASYSAATVPELIEAINTANTTPEADTIVLAPGTIYELVAPNNSVDGANGLPVIASGEDLTILGNGSVIERSTATGTPAFRLFDVASGGSLRLESVTLQGGWAAPQVGWESRFLSGGGILNQGNLALIDVAVQNNRAAWSGGGIHSTGALTIDSSILRNNQAIGMDGAAASSGREGPSDATDGSSAVGGGLTVADGTAVLSGVTVSGNLAQGGKGGNGLSGPNKAPSGSGGNGSGGGLYAAGGTVTINNSSISSNSALGGAAGKGIGGVAGQGIGGGIYVQIDAFCLLDALTVSKLKRNKASTSDPNIHGSYTQT